jgi:hypothetical protein
LAFGFGRASNALSGRRISQITTNSAAKATIRMTASFQSASNRLYRATGSFTVRCAQLQSCGTSATVRLKDCSAFFACSIQPLAWTINCDPRLSGGNCPAIASDSGAPAGSAGAPVAAVGAGTGVAFESARAMVSSVSINAARRLSSFRISRVERASPASICSPAGAACCAEDVPVRPITNKKMSAKQQKTRDGSDDIKELIRLS